MRNSPGPGRPRKRYLELARPAADYMEARPRSFYGLSELARGLEEAYPELGKVWPSTLMRALQRPSRARTPDELPPPAAMERLPGFPLRVSLPLPPGDPLHRVGHIPDWGYHATRDLEWACGEVVRRVQAGPAGPDNILQYTPDSPWKNSPVDVCRACGQRRRNVEVFDDPEGRPVVKEWRREGGWRGSIGLFCDTCLSQRPMYIRRRREQLPKAMAKRLVRTAEEKAAEGEDPKTPHFQYAS